MTPPGEERIPTLTDAHLFSSQMLPLTLTESLRTPKSAECLVIRTLANRPGTTLRYCIPQEPSGILGSEPLCHLRVRVRVQVRVGIRVCQLTCSELRGHGCQMRLTSGRATCCITFHSHLTVCQELPLWVTIVHNLTVPALLACQRHTFSTDRSGWFWLGHVQSELSSGLACMHVQQCVSCQMCVCVCDNRTNLPLSVAHTSSGVEMHFPNLSCASWCVCCAVQLIAREKAGILKAGSPGFTLPQPEDAMQALQVSRQTPNPNPNPNPNPHPDPEPTMISVTGECLSLPLSLCRFEFPGVQSLDRRSKVAVKGVIFGAHFGRNGHQNRGRHRKIAGTRPL